jgi:hypothetical protein
MVDCFLVIAFHSSMSAAFSEVMSLGARWAILILRTAYRFSMTERPGEFEGHFTDGTLLSMNVTVVFTVWQLALSC